ncbi:MAG: hydantoinase/oxoprolinase family protein, partial [Nitrososphaerota archaeon]|nr:hydantoinase/oxoprolinase family protein [Nitrososphaerota archaeon]
VGLLRIGKPATTGIRPLYSLPADLRKAIGDVWEIVYGGHEFDGREIWPLDEDAVRAAAKTFVSKGVEAVAVSSVFSPVSSAHEKKAGEIISSIAGAKVPVTLSHEIASIGLLERENASALNAALFKVASAAIAGFVESIRKMGLTAARIFLTQNDGTLMNVDYARKYPIKTIASGPTNSMRGAAFLTGLTNGIIVDIGGTTALVGAVVQGFPRESSVAVEIGGARTNFRMPDLLAVSCGGGTVVRIDGDGVKVGPESVGFRITRDSVSWGGSTLTTTDVSVGLGYAKIDDRNCDPKRVVSKFTKEQLLKAQETIVHVVEESVDKMKTSAQPVPVVLVGGGGVIVPKSYYVSFKGAERVERPDYFQYANAIGAAIAQASGEIDRIFEVEKSSREEVLQRAKDMAREDAVKAGADPATVEIVEVDEIPLSYLPGVAIRIRAKAVGRLKL